VTSAIKQLKDRKLAIENLLNDQMVKLYDSVNNVTTAEGFTLLPEQVSNLFQIEIFYSRQKTTF
jgi:hypothetical protein